MYSSIPKLAAGSRLAAADRRQAAQRPGSQPAVPGDPHLAAAAGVTLRHDERGGRTRPVHPRFRPRGVDDAVQHVSPLHGGRASDPRPWASSPTSSRAAGTTNCRSPPRSSSIANRRALYVAMFLHESPRAAMRITPSSARASPASSGRAWGSPGRDSDRRLADREPSGHEPVRPEPRPK